MSSYNLIFFVYHSIIAAFALVYTIVYFSLNKNVLSYVVENPHKNPAKEWLSDKAWGELCRLAELHAFPGLRHNIMGSSEQ